MNYKKHYNRLIKRARDRVLDCYTERHHVKPRCLGGSDAKRNIVRLTAEEHFVAHQLLVKMYPDEHGLVYSAWMMSMNRGGERQSNKRYGWMRRKFSTVHSLAMSGRISPTLGMKRSKESNAKNSIAMKGRKHSAESRAKMGVARRGVPFTEAHRENLRSAAQNRPPMSVECKQNLSQFWLGKPKSASACAKMRKPKTEEHRANMRAAWEVRRAAATCK